MLIVISGRPMSATIRWPWLCNLRHAATVVHGAGIAGHCRPASVGRVNLIQMSFYGFDNRYLLDMIKLYPDRFVGTAIVDPLTDDPGKMMESMRQSGVRAFRIQPRYSGLSPEGWLHPPGYKSMFATAARTGQALSCLIDSSGFSEVGRMCRLYPDTKVIIDHLGRIGVDGMIRDSDVKASVHWPRIPRSSSRSGPSMHWARRRLLISTWARSSTAWFRPSEPAAACGKPTAPSRSCRTATPTASSDSRSAGLPEQGRPRLAPLPHGRGDTISGERNACMAHSQVSSATRGPIIADRPCRSVVLA